jgi:hypothetical protein
MRHTITTMGMAGLGGTSPDLEQAGERRLRRKRSPRCRTPIRTLPDLSWTRAPGAGIEDLSLTIDFGKISHRGVPKTLELFGRHTGGNHPFAIMGLLKEKVGEQLWEIPLIFHGKSSNLPIDFVKIGG